MKNLIYIMFLLSIFISSACEYEIIDSKEGVSIDPVSNVQSNVNGTEIDFSWTLPSMPSEVTSPVTVRISITKDGVSAGTISVPNNPTSYIYQGFDSQYTYRFVFKVVASINTDDEYISKTSVSPGVVVEI